MLSDIRGVGVAVRSATAGCAEVFLDKWPASPIDLHLVAGCTIVGRIQDPAGKPAGGYKLHVTGMSQNFALRALQGTADASADADGFFSVPALQNDRYVLMAFSQKPGAYTQWNMRIVDVQKPKTEVEIKLTSSYFYPGYPFSAGEDRAAIPASKIDFRLQEHPIAIGGKIVSKLASAPVAGADIAIFPTTRRRGFYFAALDFADTEVDGSFKLTAPQAGKYLIVVQPTLAGLLPMERVVDIPAAGPLCFSVAAQPVVHLRLLGPDGKIVTSGNATCTMITSWGAARNETNTSVPLWAPATTGSAPGAVDLRAPSCLPDGVTSPEAATNVDIEVRVEGVGCGKMTVAHWPSDALTIPLEKGATLTGTVLDDGNKPLPNMVLSVVRTGGGNGSDSRRRAPLTAFTRQDGRFKLESLFPGAYDVRVSIPDVGIRSRSVTVPASGADLTLSPADSPIDGTSIW